MLDTRCFSTSLMYSIVFRSGDILGLLQYVTVHVGIHVSLNEPQLPSTSSSTHAAPDHDDTSTMLDCRQDTILLILITRESLHMLDTIKQSNKLTLDSSDHRTWFQPFMLLARLSLANSFQAFLWASFRKASFWDDGHANRLVAVCGAKS